MLKHRLSRVLNGPSVDSFLLLFVRVITLFLGIITTRVLSQELSVADYGTYSEITLLITTLSSLTIFGMTDACNYFYCQQQDTEDRNEYISTIFSLQYIISAVSGILILSCTVPLTRYFNNEDIKKLVVFAALQPLLQNLINMLQVLFISIGKAKAIAVRNFLVSAFRLGAFSAICYCFNNNLQLIFLSTLILDLAQAVYFGVILHKNGCRILLKKTNFGLLRRILSYCAPMAMFVITNSLCRDLDKYVVAAFTDTETLAIFSNAAKMLPFDMVAISFVTVLIPYITRYVAAEQFENARRLHRNFLELAYVSTIILAGAALAAAPQLREFLYTEKYKGGLPVFVLYLLVDILRFTNITLVLSACGKTKELFYIAIGTLSANLILNILLFHLLGIVGPALATVIVTLASGVLMLWRSAKALHCHLSDLFNGRFLLLFVIEALICLGGATLLRLWLQSQNVPYFAILLITGGAYGGIMLLLNLKRLLGNIRTINQNKLAL